MDEFKIIKIIIDRVKFFITPEREKDREKYEGENYFKNIIIDGYIMEAPEKVKESMKGNFKYPFFFEQTKYKIKFEGGNNLKDISLIIEGEAIEPSDYGENYRTFYYNWRDYVGFTDLEIKKSGKTLLKLELPVFALKMEHNLDYHRLLEFIDRKSNSLLFNINSKIHTHLKKSKSPLQEFLFKLKKHERKLFYLLSRINQDPYKKVIKVNEKKYIWKAKGNHPKISYIISKELKTVVKVESERLKNHILAQKLKTHFPLYIWDRKSVVSYDTVPNRFLKHFFYYLIKITDILLSHVKKDLKTEDVKFINSFRRKIRHYEKASFLKDVKKMKHFNVNSMVLYTDKNYSQIYNIYLDLRKTLVLDLSDMYQYRIDPLNNLYEIWVFLQIVDKLEKMGFQVIEENIFETYKNTAKLKMDENRKITLVSPLDENFKIHVWYHKTYPGLLDRERIKENEPYSFTFKRRPDVVIEKTDEQNKINKFYCAEVKYRIWEKDKYTEEIPHNAIDSLHVYRDSIIQKEENHKNIFFEKLYLIYPGIGEKYQDKLEKLERYKLSIRGWQPRKAKKQVVKFLKDILKEEEILNKILEDVRCNENSIVISKDDDEKKVKENTFKVWMCDIKLSKDEKDGKIKDIICIGNNEKCKSDGYISDDYIELFNKYITSHPAILEKIAEEYKEKGKESDETLKTDIYNEMMMRAILSEYDENIKPVEKLTKEEIDGSKDIALINFEGSHKDNDKAYIPSYSWYKENKRNREEILKKYEKKAVKEDEEDKPKMIFFFQKTKENKDELQSYSELKPEIDEIRSAVDNSLDFVEFTNINLWGLQKAGVFDIVHIGGHYDAWEGKINNAVSIQDILRTNVLAKRPLVLLMLCKSGETKELLSLANVFLMCGAGAVIGTGEEITDCEAKLFSYLFYKKIAEKQNEPAFKLFKETIEEIKKIKIENDEIRTSEGEIIECNNKIEDKEIYKKFLYFGDPEWRLV